MKKAELEQEVRRLKVENEETKYRLGNYRDNLKLIMGEYSERCKEIKNLNDYYDFSKVKEKHLQGKLDKVIDKYNALEEENTMLKEWLEEGNKYLNSQIDELIEQVEDLKEERDYWCEEYGKLVSNINLLINKYEGNYTDTDSVKAIDYASSYPCFKKGE